MDKKSKEIRIAFAGNPNAGKTTIFNALTGAHQHVGNWPGVTIEHTEAVIVEGDTTYKFIDLPGLYSLSTRSYEETIACEFLISNNIDIIVNIIDASVLERNLYLTTQLLELGIPMIFVFNMMDIVNNNKMKINFDEIANMLSVKCIKTMGEKSKNIKDILVLSKEIMSNKEKSIPRQITYTNTLESELIELENKISIKKIYSTDISNHKSIVKSGKQPIPLRWLIIKAFEDDESAISILNESVNNEDYVLKEIKKTKEKLEEIEKKDISDVITDNRYSIINGLLKDCILYPETSKKQSFTERIDNIILHRFLGIPIFIGIMYLMFYCTFTLGDYLSGYVETFVGFISNFVSANVGNSILKSLLTDGVINGVGGVLSFIPSIAIMFIMISLLEDSGYISRAAFLTDRAMHSMGLHGKSFISLLLGFGCNVPAIMATRNLESRADRVVTIMINPLMSCTARLPVYVFLTSMFFAKEYRTLVIFSLYAIGVILAIILGRIFRKTMFKTKESPFVMELPTYKMPTFKGTMFHMWNRTQGFIKRAGTTILAISIVTWLLCALPFGVEFGSKESLIGLLGKIIEPIMKPIGLDWIAAMAFIFGIGAKEIIISTLSILLGNASNLQSALASHYTPLTAYIFMLFSLIYFPCAATIAIMKKELASWKYMLISVVYPIVLAWVLCFAIYQISLLF